MGNILPPIWNDRFAGVEHGNAVPEFEFAANDGDTIENIRLMTSFGPRISEFPYAELELVWEKEERLTLSMRAVTVDTSTPPAAGSAESGSFCPFIKTPSNGISHRLWEGVRHQDLKHANFLTVDISWMQ
jgi:hypothetical protein